MYGTENSAVCRFPPDEDPASRNLLLRAKLLDIHGDAKSASHARAISDGAKEPKPGLTEEDRRVVTVGASSRTSGGRAEDDENTEGHMVPHSTNGTADPARSARPHRKPWKLARVVMGHAGWVRAIAVEPGNQWFATGSADRTIKTWDLATGILKLTLTGHISTVRGLALSERHPYMFSVAEDKTVKCWDLERNRVIRNYHGHLSGVYAVALHPTLDVLFTAGRDAAVRVWDMRTSRQVHTLTGHRDAINAVVSQASDPQVVSASVDSTVRLWDLAAGRCMSTLTNHKKGVRALALHRSEFSFASASADSIKTWSLPRGDFMRNLRGDQGLVNALAINADGVLVSGQDAGTLDFWDYGTSTRFQSLKTPVQPGSLSTEAGVCALCFEHSGSRLISGEVDKTIKIWKEDAPIE